LQVNKVANKKLYSAITFQHRKDKFRTGDRPSLPNKTVLPECTAKYKVESFIT